MDDLREDDPERALQTCPRHGRVIDDAAEGLCPACLFLGAIEDDIEPDAGQFPVYFAGYELLETLGTGGMGVVYKARQVSGIRRVVALKRIRDGELADASARRRFLGEAKAAAALEHIHVVPILDFGEYEGELYFTMQLMRGGTLLEAAARFAHPMRAAELVGKLARAAHAGHSKKLLHRDLKPANILFDDQGEPHIADFGIAKRLDEIGTTLTGALVGTVHYMAPEQVCGPSKLDSAAPDVWSLGVILYELLAGERPFVGHTPLDVIRSITEHEPKPLSRARPGLDRDLMTICVTCLQKAPQRRYLSAEALAEDLERYQRNEPVLARPPRLRDRAGDFLARYPARSLLFGAAVLALVTLTSWALASARQQERARRNEVLAANVFAARALAGSVLAQLREYADKVAEEASDPGLADALMRQDTRELQERCEAMHDRHADASSPFDLWFITDAMGNGFAYKPTPLFAKSYYINFAFRDYFRGAKAFPPGTSRPVYVSRAILSTNDDRYKFAITAPIRAADGSFAGVLATTIHTNRHLGSLALSDERRIAVLTIRRDRDMPQDDLPNDHIFLVHDGAALGDGVAVESDALRRLTARRDAANVPLDQRLRLPPADWVEAQDDYIDVLAKAGPDGERGPWLAGIATVGSTELSVIVQTRLDDATALDRLPFRVLVAWSTVGGGLLLFGAVFAVLRSRTVIRRLPPK